MNNNIFSLIKSLKIIVNSKGSIIIQIGLYTAELKSIKNITDAYKQGIKDYNKSNNIVLIINPDDIIVFIG